MNKKNTWAILAYDKNDWPIIIWTELKRSDAEVMCQELNQQLHKEEDDTIDHYEIVKLNR